MACHWDGYVGNTNNYRIYFPRTSGAYFLPHGMDQMFQDSEYSIFEPRASIVGRSVRQHSEWNQKFRQRVRELLPQFEPQQLTHRLEQLEQRLRPEFVKLDPDCEPHRDQILADWRERLFRRYSSIEEQLALPDPAEPTDQQHELLELPPGQVLELGDWYPRQESEDAILSADAPEQQTGQEPDTALVYSISAGDSGQCIASWRRTVLLPAGKYRVAAEMKVWGVVPIRDERGRGAGLRISGASREQSLEGSGAWQTVEFEFSLAEDLSFVEFVSELRAAAGVSQMRRPSLTRLELP
jgi:hypothetical protein